MKYKVCISNVAVRYIADKPVVAAVIIGARLGISEHIATNQAAYSFPGTLTLSLSIACPHQIVRVLCHFYKMIEVRMALRILLRCST